MNNKFDFNDSHVDLLPTKVKFGFTLAEVLITLGIIGIVAAMTIPTLISRKQKLEIETQLKETYSIIQQGLKMAENDDLALNSEVTEYTINDWFDTYFAPYIKYSRVCYDSAGCWQNFGPTKNLSGNTTYISRTGIGIGANIVTIKLTNGSNLILDSYGVKDLKQYMGLNVSHESLVIIIDANGDKRPNIIGKDIFFSVLTDKGLVPVGVDESNDTLNKNCSATATGVNAGYYCLLKVKNNGWTIPDDVWNKKI